MAANFTDDFEGNAVDFSIFTCSGSSHIENTDVIGFSTQSVSIILHHSQPTPRTITGSKYNLQDALLQNNMKRKSAQLYDYKTADMKTYGQIITAERKRQGLSGRRLAQLVDVSETHLRNIENGRRQTTPQTLQRIARALAINPSRMIEAWMLESLEGIDYDPELLSYVRKPDMDFEQIETMYGIDRARAVYEKINACTTGKKMKALDPDTLLEVRVALKNCLGMIDDIKNS